MKSLFLGIAVILIIGIGGFIYRNAVEHPAQPTVCPLDHLTCPDGTAVSRAGLACLFRVCPPPNTALPEIRIAFAIPEGFVSAERGDAATVAAYELPVTASSTKTATIVIRRYAITASSTALATIQQTAIGGASGLPVDATAYSSREFGTNRFSIVRIERFEGVIDTAYYLARATDVLRFDAIDTGVTRWTDRTLDVSGLFAHAALEKLLSTLQEQ